MNAGDLLLPAKRRDALAESAPAPTLDSNGSTPLRVIEILPRPIARRIAGVNDIWNRTPRTRGRAILGLIAANPQRVSAQIFAPIDHQACRQTGVMPHDPPVGHPGIMMNQNHDGIPSMPQVTPDFDGIVFRLVRMKSSRPPQDVPAIDPKQISGIAEDMQNRRIRPTFEFKNPPEPDIRLNTRSCRRAPDCRFAQNP